MGIRAIFYVVGRNFMGTGWNYGVVDVAGVEPAPPN
jgi:hypothetical protein